MSDRVISPAEETEWSSGDHNWKIKSGRSQPMLTVEPSL